MLPCRCFQNSGMRRSSFFRCSKFAFIKAERSRMTRVTGMKKLHRTAAMLTVSACILGVYAPPTTAETLSEVLAYTYRTNPTLNAARANLRVVDEGVPRAKGGWLPTVSSTLSVGYYNADVDTNVSSSDGSSTPKSAILSVTQPNTVCSKSAQTCSIRNRTRCSMR